MMSNMISELKGVGHEKTDEQQVQAVICFFQVIGNTYVLTLPTMTTLRHLTMLLIMSSLKKIDFKLKSLEAFIYETKMRGAYGSKYKRGKAKGPKYGKRGI